MKTVGIISILAAAASATTVSYDEGYDQAGRSLTAVSCSDGDNGLITKYGYQTQGAIPGFPSIGGSSDIAGWDSPQCGKCYQVTYNGVSINFVAIDHVAEGVNLSKEAMDNLTGGQAVAKGRVDATVTQVDVSQCGLIAKRSIEFNA
ncbi:hypothetical protein DOTSEDRAFT_70155 [Dothistroma septosporum NZE10]|uniref:Uncharacterized protein n=1 Tax=Dothistroma septosporum (strain NZE10 / CBS 128990) TaxID=675120 RepID=N1PRP8_DOTSN|nr:hypothetical protein DOTSEDRAFT_70155 [Dothistroma septosporum NZE10]